MAQIQKHLFDIVVAYVENLSSFHSYMNSFKQFGNSAELRRKIAELHDHTKTFLQTTQTGSDAAKSITAFSKWLLRINKSLQDIVRGLETETINSAKATREAYKIAVLPNVTSIIEYAKTLEANASEESMKSELDFAKQRGASKAVVKLLDQSLKNLKGVEAPTEASRIKQIDEEAGVLMKQYRALSTKLPSSLKGRMFTLVELPIVPYIDFTLVDPKFLRTTGIDVTHIAESFVVFNEQKLLAFDYVVATTEDESKRKAASLVKTASTLAARKRDSKHRTLQEEFVIDVLSRINEKSDEEYTLMSSHFEHCPTNGRIAFAWIVPLRIQKIFARRGSLADATWGFPWDKRTTAKL